MEHLYEDFKKKITGEIIFAVQKMREHENPEQKLFFFSAIYSIIQRVCNIEYNKDLIFAYLVINNTYQMFMARLRAIKAGETTIQFSKDQFDGLEDAALQMIKALESNQDLTPALKAFSIIAYSTTGNGYYLKEKGILKVGA